MSTLILKFVEICNLPSRYYSLTNHFTVESSAAKTLSTEAAPTFWATSRKTLNSNGPHALSVRDPDHHLFGQ